MRGRTTVLFLTVAALAAVLIAGTARISAAADWVDDWSQGLNLSTDQQQQARQIVDEARDSADRVDADTSLNETQKKARIDAIESGMHERLSAILTPEQKARARARDKSAAAQPASNEARDPEVNGGIGEAPARTSVPPTASTSRPTDDDETVADNPRASENPESRGPVVSSQSPDDQEDEVAQTNAQPSYNPGYSVPQSGQMPWYVPVIIAAATAAIPQANNNSGYYYPQESTGYSYPQYNNTQYNTTQYNNTQYSNNTQGGYSRGSRTRPWRSHYYSNGSSTSWRPSSGYHSGYTQGNSSHHSHSYGYQGNSTRPWSSGYQGSSTRPTYSSGYQGNSTKPWSSNGYQGGSNRPWGGGTSTRPSYTSTSHWNNTSGYQRPTTHWNGGSSNHSWSTPRPSSSSSHSSSPHTWSSGGRHHR